MHLLLYIRFLRMLIYYFCRYFFFFFFFFKQKTAYEMRISDWSSDVCSSDLIDALSARPDFAILEFPGPLHAAEHVTADSPPLLLGAANDDACCSAPTVDLLQAYRQAGASAEIHLYAAGGHAFNLGEDTPLVSLQHWPQVVLAWLSEDRTST